MKLADFNKLKKLMNMTLSGADQEKLTAINAANEIIARSNTTWDRVLDRVIKVEVEIESAEAAEGPARAAFRKKVSDAFTEIEESDPRGDFADFISSLKAQWERNARLSEAQLEALFRSARNARDKANEPSFGERRR